MGHFVAILGHPGLLKKTYRYLIVKQIRSSLWSQLKSVFDYLSLVFLQYNVLTNSFILLCTLHNQKKQIGIANLA